MSEKGVTGAGLSFDQFLDSRVGFGARQRAMTFIVCLLLLSEGLESMVIAVVLPVMLKLWQLESFRLAVVTFVYLGVTVGSYLQHSADSLGRKRVLEAAALLQAVTGLLSCVSSNYPFFLGVRFLFGLGIGIVFPLSGTILAQISPTQLRTVTLAYSRIAFSVGSSLSAVLAWLFLNEDDPLNSNWRLLLLLSAVPGLLGLVLLRTHGLQSPRFLLVQGRTEEGLAVVEQMMKGTGALLASDRQQLVAWARQESLRQQQKLGYGQLFSARYVHKSLVLALVWISACVCFYTLNFVLPLVLQGTPRTVRYLILEASFAVEVVSTFLSVGFIDRQGRLRSLLAFCGLSLCGFLALQAIGLGALGWFSLVVVVLKFVTIATFIALYPYTAQTYHTLVRSKAMSFVNVVSRLFFALLALALGPLLDRGLLFGAVAVVPLLALLALHWLGHETKGNELDC